MILIIIFPVQGLVCQIAIGLDEGNWVFRGKSITNVKLYYIDIQPAFSISVLRMIR
jgi:hypothetical protein